MHILIDSQKSVETAPVWRAGEDGDPWLTLDFGDAHSVLTAWKDLDPSRRNFRYGGAEDDESPSVIIIAWVGRGDALVMVDVDPHYDGLGTVNAYRLDELHDALPTDAIEWGEQIGEDDTPPLPSWAKT